MPPNIRNKTKSQALQLLKDYYDLPSQILQDEIVHINIELVYKVIFSVLGTDSELDEKIISAGTIGLAEAIKDFNPNLNQPFDSFAISYIQKYIIPFSVGNLENKQVSPEESQKTDIENANKSTISSPNSQKNYHNFRLSEEDTNNLQQVMLNLEKQAGKSFDADDTPSGPLKSETLQLLKVYRSQPSARLRNCLVQLNIGLVRKEAYHWANQCSEAYEDLMQIGSIGLIRAIERFDMERGHAFSSFAVPYIRGEIQHYLRDKSPTVRVPRRWLVLYNQGCKVILQLRVSLRREPSDREVADLINVEVSEWQEIKLSCRNRSPLSLDAPVHDDEDGGSSLGDLVPDAKYRSFQLAQEDSLRLHQALSHLEDRTREIVEFVFLKEFTHREVAEILGISAVTVSRQVKKGVTILKKVMNTPLD